MAAFLAAYHFDGDPAELLAQYDDMRRSFPDDSLMLHACVCGVDGITIYDACPDRATFEAFSSSEGFAAEVARAGLPAPRIVPLGEIHSATASL